MIVTNNNKVFNFYKETDDVIFLDDAQSFSDVIDFVKQMVFEGHELLSDPILYNLENPNNPFKSLLLSKGIYGDNVLSKETMKKISSILKKVPTFGKKEEFSEKILEEFRFIDLNMLNDGLKQFLSI
jgi:hypothetical protein